MGTIVDTSKGIITYLDTMLKKDMHVCLRAVLLLTLMWTSSQAVTLRHQIERKVDFCFFENFTDIDAEIYRASYYILDGGDTRNELTFYIIHPKHGKLYVSKEKVKGIYEFTPEPAVYAFCLENNRNWKLVEFSLHTTIKRSSASKPRKLAYIQTMMEGMIEEIEDYNQEIMNLQVGYRRKSTYGLINAVKLNAAVKKWSLVQGVMAVLAGLGQVFIVRKLFEETQGT